MRILPSLVATLVAAASLAAPARAQFVDGDLYVGGYPSTIYRVEPGSWNVTVFADANDNLNDVSATVISPAGTLLCSNYLGPTVLEFDSAGNGSVLFDKTDGLVGPWGENGLAYDANGDLYIGDLAASKIWRCAGGTGSPTVFANSGDGIVGPDGLAFSADGDLYVANRGTKDVLKIDPAGNATVFDTLPNEPYSTVARSNGDLYVATYVPAGPPSIYRYPGGDAAQRTLLLDAKGNSSSPALQLSLDEQTLYFTSYGTGNLLLIDADDGTWTEVIPKGGMPGALAIAVVGQHHSAKWTNYGAGVAGTHGVPSFTSQQDPVLGTTITLDVGNSWGQPTSGLLCLGFQQASLHTGLGGDLLLIPALLAPITFSYGSDSFTGALPGDPALIGFEVDLQAVEVDPGAVKGFSFTQGLELLLGY